MSEGIHEKRVLKEIAYQGAVVGVRVALKFFLIYLGVVVSWLVIAGISEGFGSSHANVWDLLSEGAMFFLTIVTYAFIIVFPIVLMIGLITGSILGGSLKRLRRHMSRARAVVFGISFGIVVTLFFLIVLMYLGIFPPPIIFPIPNIIYIAACGWMSMKFYGDNIAEESAS